MPITVTGNSSRVTAFAVDFGDYTEDVSVEGGLPNYTVWFKYVAKAGETVVGFWARHATQGHSYNTTVYKDVDSSSYLFFGSSNRPLQVPVTPGSTYYFEVHPLPLTTSPTGFPLTVTVTQAPNAAAALGQLVVNDDTGGYPAARMDPVSGTIAGFTNFPAGEGAEVMPNGDILVHDNVSNLLSLFDKTLTLKWSISQTVVGHPPMTSDRVDTFYVANGGAGVNQTFYKISRSAQAIVGTFVPTNSPFPVGIAVKPDNSVLYYACGINGSPIRTWDLVNGVELTPFVSAPPASPSGTKWAQDLILFPDGSVVAAVNSSLIDDTLYHFNSSGTVIHSLDLGVAPTANHLARGVDDTTFWLWTYESSQVHRWRQIRVSDFAVITDYTTTEFDQGISNASAAASMDLFGTSNSCPFFIIAASSATPPLVDLSTPCCDATPGGGSTAGSTPPADDTKPLPPWIPTCSGNATLPDGVTYANSEDWRVA